MPFTDNLKEQDVRMMEVRSKILNRFMPEQAAQDLPTLHNVLSNAPKQGQNPSRSWLQGSAILFAAFLSQQQSSASPGWDAPEPGRRRFSSAGAGIGRSADLPRKLPLVIVAFPYLLCCSHSGQTVEA